MPVSFLRKLPSFLSLPRLLGGALYLLLMVWVFFFYHGFNGGSKSAVTWLISAWNPETDYEHGWMVPLLSLYLLFHAVCGLKKEKAEAFRGSLSGLVLVFLGGLLTLLALRTQQGRVAIGAIPVLLSGLVWCYWGTRAALKTAFPIFFLWLSVPLPGFQQATVSLQLLSTQAAHWGAGICGVETIMEGTNITSANGNWDTYNIAGGCSGIRSLMALIMISAAWGYLADGLSLWKRLVLGFSAIPLSIFANAFRVASIFVCAEYVNPAFAGKTWHDWSGMLFFFPASLLCLAALHGLLSGEIPFLKRRRVVVRQGGAAATTVTAAPVTTENGKENA